VTVFSREIGGRLALIGAALLVASLFARLYFSGVDLTAFELVDRLGLERATAFVMESYVDMSYGLWRIPVTASAGSILGAVLLAVAGWRARKLGVLRCALLLSFGWVFMGVLKEATLVTVLHGGVAAVVLFGWSAYLVTASARRPVGSGRARRSRILS
jgi:hypothetical protein